MNKYIVWGLGLVVGFGTAYMMRANSQPQTPLSGEPQPAAQTQNNSECGSLCEAAAAACPSMVNKELCISRCPEFDAAKKEVLAAARSCEELAKNPELVADVAIPDQIVSPETTPAENDCQAACDNYVNKCLTLVPGANQSLYDDGRSSCLEECAGWEAQKIDCMKSAGDCPAMTEQCGL